MIVYHGTTIEHTASVEREGLRPNSYVAASRELAVEYATIAASRAALMAG